ncbi:MAG: L,D-transpeptidase family protein [Chloroflexi bacterium]|nr:L,D-transpeptidase family protein [Chloroflexota bacterium]
MSDNRLLIQRAGEAVKAGNKRQARSLLLQAVRQNAGDHLAWLGLARVSVSPQASLDYARRAARLKPGDPLVQKVLAWAEKRAENGKRLAANSQQSTINNEQSTTSDQQPATGDQQPAVDRRLPTAVTWTAVAFIVIFLVGAGSIWAWNKLGNRETTAADPPNKSSAAIAAQPERSLPNSEPETAGEDSAAAEASPPTATPTPTQSTLQPKRIAERKEGEPLPTWTITPTPTNTPTPSPTPIPTFVSPNNRQPTGRPFGVGANEHWIDVNLSAQTLTAYEGNTAVYDTYISSGLSASPTVTGQFRIWLRYASQTMDGARLGYDYYLENVPYVMYFYEDYALHGTFWHNNFGYPMSHGCVNMRTSDAQWVFDWSTIGTVVNVHY